MLSDLITRIIHGKRSNMNGTHTIKEAIYLNEQQNLQAMEAADSVLQSLEKFNEKRARFKSSALKHIAKQNKELT